MKNNPDARRKGYSLRAICLLLFFFCLSSGANRIHAQSLAYVTHPSDNTVSVINTESNTVITSIPVGDGPLAVALTPDGTLAYIANQTDSTVSVIDTASKTVIATIPVGSFPVAPKGARSNSEATGKLFSSGLLLSAHTLVLNLNPILKSQCEEMILLF